MNNAQASHLSSADYGYDFVVATTQQGINATMKRFMATLDAPLISRCYKPDPDPDPARRGAKIEVSHDEIMKTAKTDPFDIPDGTPLHEVRDKLNNYQFVEGWRARIGIDKSAIPTMGNIVERTTSMETVQFNMYCKEFQVAGWVWGAEPWDDSIWLNVSQPKTAPWKITRRVNLTQQTVDWKAQGDNVPHDAVKALQNLDKESPESVFTVEPLLLDLTRTELTATRPTLDSLEQNTALYTMLMETFLGP
ncbi:hypothetical protein BDV34DRAFT_231514 [Aspergillus parasiticus]|uniref:Uncharacterized protein n=1 Tax=Aspergillus parasiticus TaxID=5067 RepID=A0A5N6D4D4_ASPPA|nr:hypothetical protein BDV34DRAFT_231514 [Aspergillus parasiticus]